MFLSGYYGYKDKRNAGIDYTNGTTAAQTDSVAKSLRSILHSAGTSLSAACTPKVNSSVSLDWTQNDFKSILADRYLLLQPDFFLLRLNPHNVVSFVM